jgi:hypothetical protein
MESFKRIYSFCETPPGVIKAVDCGIGTPGNLEFSYFHSSIITDEEFALVDVPNIIIVLQPVPPESFLMFNLASSSPGSGISSSGVNLQFINTIEAGFYEFHIQFTIGNIGTDPEPELTLTLGTTGGVPYVNPVTGIFEVTTEFQPHLDKNDGALEHLAVMHGVVNLPALSITAVLIKTGGPQNVVQYKFGTFDVTVKKLA